MKEFRFVDISKHRTALMGIATLMIILCHAPASGVLMPSIMGRVLGFCNVGVDIFLFLSGIGCYYSFSRSTSLFNYYKKRYVRIGIPYLIITMPFLIVYIVIGFNSVSDALLSILTLDFWIEHKGAWFISLLLPLYFLSPLIYYILCGKKKICTLPLLLIGLIYFSHINVGSFIYSDILSNIQFAFKRVPNYILGMVIGEMCYKDVCVSDKSLIVSVVGGAFCTP